MNLRHLSILVSLAVVRTALGQTDTPTDPKLPTINFQILKSWKLDLGNRSIFLNRVAPPLLPERPVIVAQPAPPSAEDIEVARRREGKNYEVLFLSATVYNRQFSEVRWMDSRREWRALSNIDFNLVPCMGTFESADTVYSLLLAIDNQTTGASGRIERHGPSAGTSVSVAERFPALDKLSTTHAQYLVVAEEPSAVPQEKDLSAMDAVHAFFDLNRKRLAAEFAKYEAARIEQERIPKEPPPVPKDTVIHYWKMDAAAIQAATEEKRK